MVNHVSLMPATPDVDSMLGLCWTNVEDGGPTLVQRLVFRICNKVTNMMNHAVHIAILLFCNKTNPCDTPCIFIFLFRTSSHAILIHY